MTAFLLVTALCLTNRREQLGIGKRLGLLLSVYQTMRYLLNPLRAERLYFNGLSWITLTQVFTLAAGVLGVCMLVYGAPIEWQTETQGEREL